MAEPSDQRRGRAAPLLAVMIVFCVGAASFVIWPVQKSEWVAKVRAVVEPSASQDSPDLAYQLDVLSRRGIMSTFAGLVDSPSVQAAAKRDVERALGERSDARITASGSRDTAVITITVRSDRRDVARRTASAVRRHGIRYVNGLDALYRVRAVSAPGQVTFDTGLLLQPVLALLSVWGLGVAALVWLVRRGREEPATVGNRVG